MRLLAVIDATNIEACEGPATMVAGLSLLERSARLAAVCGADALAIRLSDPGHAGLLDHRESDLDISISIISSAEDIDAVDRPDAILSLDAGVVFERSFVQRSVDAFEREDAADARRDRDAHIALSRCDTLKTLQQSLESPGDFRRKARPVLSGGWTVVVDSADARKRAARRLWNGCRKPEDGLVSRYLNRHLSLALSKILAPTSVRPNHVTFVTFGLGIFAALAASWGSYFGFLAAGILYQLNSVIDGVDGELARVRYEFSLTGEWLDTISDDMADLLLYLGIGIGAWRTMADAPGPWGVEIWLGLGVIAAVAKLASMIVYYRWLIAHGRGDLLAFQWSFEDDDGQNGLSRILSISRYFFRKDFIVFAAMVLSIAGFLPHLLFALAPGNAVVALSVVLQQLRGNRTPG